MSANPCDKKCTLQGTKEKDGSLTSGCYAQKIGTSAITYVTDFVKCFDLNGKRMISVSAGENKKEIFINLR